MGEKQNNKQWRNYSNFSRGYTYFPMYWYTDSQSGDRDDTSSPDNTHTYSDSFIEEVVDRVLERMNCKYKNGRLSSKKK